MVKMRNEQGIQKVRLHPVVEGDQSVKAGDADEQEALPGIKTMTQPVLGAGLNMLSAIAIDQARHLRSHLTLACQRNPASLRAIA
jgi:hypothetical protein